MLKIKDVMRKKKIAVTTTTSLQKICEQLIQSGLSGLPVVDAKQNIVGFVSERDIITVLSKQNYIKKTASEIMRKSVSTVEDSASLNDAFQIFAKKPYRLLPVKRNGKYVGILSRQDMVGKMLGRNY